LAAPDTVVLTRFHDFQNEGFLIASKLVCDQFGLRTKLVANQFESGLDFADKENRVIKQGCRGRRSCRGPESSGEMKIKAAALATSILLAASFSFAAKKKPPRPFQLRDVVILNGAQVPAGIYELTWETHGSSARVTLWQDGKFVATAQGASVKNGVKFTEDEALLRVNSDGTKSLIEIRIAGAARAIVFNQTDAPVHYSAMKP
jgi:hypothetical protein